jgi:O-methyltransferase
MKVTNLKGYALLMLGIKPNEVLGFRLITFLAKWWLPGYKFTWPELAWFRDARLNRLLGHYGELRGFNAHRRYALRQLLRLTSAVPGDTAECGVFKGCGSQIILESNQSQPLPRTHHIFDSFQGLSNPTDADGEYWKEGDLSVGLEDVRERLGPFGNLRLHKGWIPERFQDIEDARFSFVHVDVDLHEPTLESIRFFYSRLNPGGIFVCDDYGFLTCPGATAAVDGFLESKLEKMISLPGGGGFFIKGCATTPE